MEIFATIPNNKKAILMIKKKSGDVPLPCHFNPENYTISRDIGWQPQPIKGQNVPTSEFKGGGPNKTQLNLLFDTTMDKAVKDVRDYTKKLWDATKIDEANLHAVTQKGEPPHVVFMWGRSWSFEGVITSLSEQFVLFSDEGIPLRSNIQLGLTQVVDDTTFGKQNPTSGGIPGGKLYTVREGDRLDLIAAQQYDKPMMWRHIAEYNDIDNPRNLVPGSKLIIPPLP